MPPSEPVETLPSIELPSVRVWPPRLDTSPVPLVQTIETGEVENGLTRLARGTPRHDNVVPLRPAAERGGG